MLGHQAILNHSETVVGSLLSPSFALFDVTLRLFSSSSLSSDDERIVLAFGPSDKDALAVTCSMLEPCPNDGSRHVRLVTEMPVL